MRIMRFIADLHIHSKYSRATSKEMAPEELWRWAQLKGITVVATGDFTHPAWLAELREKLEPAAAGLFSLKKEFQPKDVPEACRGDVFFMLSSEISSIYKKNGKTRKVHSIVYLPDFADAVRLSAALSRIGNINSDGRPILGLDAKELFKIVRELCPAGIFVPAHAWTPHFSVFGAESGFDSLEECFDELTPEIFAIETGLSSDPGMNWRWSALDHLTLISNSDAHSPAKIGREANIFDVECTYEAVAAAIKTRKGFLGTIEFFPEEGKYHNDGHRTCGVNLAPEETVKGNFLCPVCGKKVTVGVLHRVEKLADRKEAFRPEGAPTFFSIIPLPEILAEVLQVGPASKAVDAEYQKLLQKLGSEFRVLLEFPLDDIERAGSPLVREAIARMRAGKVHITPGFDGEYGRIKIFEGGERKEIKGQATLF